MTQREAVIQTLERLGGIATLGTLYQEVFKITECTWKTKTPFASIRQIVQLAPEIYKIKPGLWALESHRKELELNGIFEQTEKNKESAEVKNFNHSYYQGLLLTMGNLRGKNTFVPNQDKNKRFDNSILLEDLLFGSPSGAASFVCGMNTNGRNGWKTAEGITLKELEENVEE